MIDNLFAWSITLVTIVGGWIYIYKRGDRQGNRELYKLREDFIKKCEKRRKIREYHDALSRERAAYKTLYRPDALNIIPTAQEDPRCKESIKNVGIAFEKQHKEMQARALKRHASDCPDPLTCTKNPCWVWESDKIVGDPETVAAKQEAIDRYARYEMLELQKGEFKYNYLGKSYKLIIKEDVQKMDNKSYTLQLWTITGVYKDLFDGYDKEEANLYIEQLQKEFNKKQ